MEGEGKGREVGVKRDFWEWRVKGIFPIQVGHQQAKLPAPGSDAKASSATRAGLGWVCGPVSPPPACPSSSSSSSSSSSPKSWWWWWSTPSLRGKGENQAKQVILEEVQRQPSTGMTLRCFIYIFCLCFFPLFSRFLPASFTLGDVASPVPQEKTKTHPRTSANPRIECAHRIVDLLPIEVTTGREVRYRRLGIHLTSRHERDFQCLVFCVEVLPLIGARSWVSHQCL